MGEENGQATDNLSSAAVQVALRTGLLKQCTIHGEVYDPGQRDLQGALMVINYLINNSDPIVALFDGDRAGLTQLLKSILKSKPRACPQCTPACDPAA